MTLGTVPAAGNQLGVRFLICFMRRLDFKLIAMNIMSLVRIALRLDVAARLII